jgi:hypothetical protein
MGIELSLRVTPGHEPVAGQSVSATIISLLEKVSLVSKDCEEAERTEKRREYIYIFTNLTKSINQPRQRTLQIRQRSLTSIKRIKRNPNQIKISLCKFPRYKNAIIKKVLKTGIPAIGDMNHNFNG